MTLKDIIASDISTFLNSLEFGEVHNIDGMDITIVIDNDLLEQKSQKSGLYLGDILFFIATSDLAVKPVNLEADKIITFDSASYRILKVIEEEGISQVYLTSEPGKRFLTVYYRSSTGTGGNSDLGIMPTKTAWEDANLITPNPQYEEISNNMQVEDIGLIRSGDIRLKINKTEFTKDTLEGYDYLVNGKEYSLINGQVLEDNLFFTLFLRRVQA